MLACHHLQVVVEATGDLESRWTDEFGGVLVDWTVEQFSERFLLIPSRSKIIFQLGLRSETGRNESVSVAVVVVVEVVVVVVVVVVVEVVVVVVVVVEVVVVVVVVEVVVVVVVDDVVVVVAVVDVSQVFLAYLISVVEICAFDVGDV